MGTTSSEKHPSASKPPEEKPQGAKGNKHLIAPIKDWPFLSQSKQHIPEVETLSRSFETSVHTCNAPVTTVQRVENARREAREVCSNVKLTGRRGILCSARRPGGRAGRRKNSEKNPASCAAAVVKRARRCLSMPGAAYSAGHAVVFSMTVWTHSLRETQRHSHTDTQRHAHRLFLSQLQPGIVRVRVAMVPAWMLLIERTRNTDVIMVPAWMLLIERTRNTDVIMVPAWMLLIKRTRNTDVIMVPAWMLLIEPTRNTDVIMVPAWMLLIERTRNTDVIVVPAWMLLIKRTRNTDVIVVPAWMLLIERTRNTDVIVAPAWMLLIERTRNTDVIMVPAWMLLIERTRNTDVILVPAWMLLIERTRNTDVIMVPAWMLLIECTRNTDVIMVPAWMLLIKRTRNADVIMVPAWMLLVKRTTNTDVFMPSASASAMRAEGFTPCVVAGRSRRAWARTHFLRVYGPSEPVTSHTCAAVPSKKRLT